jgi:hypothetical protein
MVNFSSEINALPQPLREYIHDIEARCDPAADIRKLRLASEENDLLRRQLAILKEREQLERSWRCFHCDEVFTDEETARAHFGTEMENDHPACVKMLTTGQKTLIREAAVMFRRALQSEAENELLGHKLQDIESIIRHRFQVASLNDVFNLYDSMEGRALAAEALAATLERYRRSGEVAHKCLDDAGIPGAHDVPLAQRVTSLVDRLEDSAQYRVSVAEAHRRLDEAGIPKAEHAPCSDPACETLLGHRVKLLIERYSAVAVDLSNQIRETLASLRLVADPKASEARPIVHEPIRTEAGDPAHGCEGCDGEDTCTCGDIARGAKCKGCGGEWPFCMQGAAR